jgi:hypothetical protein
MKMFLHFITTPPPPCYPTKMPSSLSPLLVFFLRVTGIEALHIVASDEIWDHSQVHQKLVVFNTNSLWLNMFISIFTQSIHFFTFFLSSSPTTKGAKRGDENNTYQRWTIY